MRIFYLIVFILYLSTNWAQCAVDNDFVDPLDILNYDRATNSMKKVKTKLDNEPMQINDRCTIFLSRFINLLLKNTGLDNVDDTLNEDIKAELQSYASVTISVGDLHMLKNMITNKDLDYIEIDRILNIMFKPIKKDFSELQMANGFLGISIEIKETLYWISIGCILICLLYKIFHSFFRWFSIPFVIFVVFALAFASTWYTMYTKAEINRKVHLDYMPSHCYKKTGYWYSWFTNVQNLDECKQYKEAIDLDPKFSFAITEVFAEMISKMMMKPFESMGESIYVFNKSVLKDFPMWAKLCLVPIITVFIIKTMLVSCALLVGRHISLKSFFGHGSTTIGSEQIPTDRLTTNNRIDNSIHPMASGQHTITQMPQIPKVNFNINLFHPNSLDNTANTKNSSFNDQLNIKYKKKEFDFISMLKNENNDTVDNKDFNDPIVNQLRPRTLSI